MEIEKILRILGKKIGKNIGLCLTEPNCDIIRIPGPKKQAIPMEMLIYASVRIYMRKMSEEITVLR